MSEGFPFSPREKVAGGARRMRVWSEPSETRRLPVALTWRFAPVLSRSAGEAIAGISFPAYEPDYCLDRHPLVLVASFGAGQVDVEDFAKGIFVRYAKETERANRHVNVDGVKVVAKSAGRPTSFKDVLDHFYDAMIDLPDLISVFDR